MSQSSRSTQKIQFYGALLLILLPAIYFYYALWKTSSSLPILDDYDIILDATNHLVGQHGSRLAFLFLNLHNGYKLIFENATVLAEYSLIGKIHMLPLIWIGNAFAVVIFITVMAMSALPSSDPAKKIALMIPVAYFIFQLQYASALNFASSSLQHLAVVAFSLLSIYFLSRNSPSSFLLACISLLLAISASPNGFFVVPAGVLMLFQYKRWKPIAIWIAVTAAMLALYLYHYVPPTSPASDYGTPLPPSLHLKLFYALSFLGASAARYTSVTPSLILGLLFCGMLIFALYRRYFRQNPAVFYSILFIFLNAVAVSFIRSDAGIEQSLASRYRTYSNLLLAFSYMFLIENVLSEIKNLFTRRSVLAFCFLFAVAFCVVSSVAGIRFLESKKEVLVQTYIAQWQNKSAGLSLSSDMDNNPALARQIERGVYRVHIPVMEESVRLGVYAPPQLH